MLPWNVFVATIYNIFSTYEYPQNLEAPTFRKVLDDMEEHYYGKGARYNDQDYNQLLKCMSRDDDLLV